MAGGIRFDALKVKDLIVHKEEEEGGQTALGLLNENWAKLEANNKTTTKQTFKSKP